MTERAGYETPNLELAGSNLISSKVFTNSRLISLYKAAFLSCFRYSLRRAASLLCFFFIVKIVFFLLKEMKRAGKNQKSNRETLKLSLNRF